MTVEGHPQRQEIIDAMLAGKSLRNIAATLATPLHYTTLARFRRNMLGQATQRLRPTGSIVKAIVARSAPLSEDKSNETLREALQQSILKLDQRRERWIADAESYQTVDPETGEVSHNMQHSALSRHAGNALTAIELRAKLAGLLQTGSGVLQVNNTVLLMPRTDDEPGVASMPSVDKSVTIDVTPTSDSE